MADPVFLDNPGGGEGVIVFPEEPEAVPVEYGIVGPVHDDGLGEIKEGTVTFLKIDGETVAEPLQFDPDETTWTEAIEEEADEWRA